jgi:hypothetical protein
MPDPAKSVGDIDDVLSSIRRLVAEQPSANRDDKHRAEAGASTSGGDGRLVLTPALRVTDPHTSADTPASPREPATADLAAESAEAVPQSDARHDDVPVDIDLDLSNGSEVTSDPQDPALEGPVGVDKDPQDTLVAGLAVPSDIFAFAYDTPAPEAPMAVDPTMMTNDTAPVTPDDTPMTPEPKISEAYAEGASEDAHRDSPDTMQSGDATDIAALDAAPDTVSAPEMDEDPTEQPVAEAWTSDAADGAGDMQPGSGEGTDHPDTDAADSHQDARIVGDAGWRPEMRLFDWEAAVAADDAANAERAGATSEFEPDTGDADWPGEGADRAVLDLAAARETGGADVSADTDGGPDDGADAEAPPPATGGIGFTPIFSRRPAVPLDPASDTTDTTGAPTEEAAANTAAPEEMEGEAAPPAEPATPEALPDLQDGDATFAQDAARRAPDTGNAAFSRVRDTWTGAEAATTETPSAAEEQAERDTSPGDSVVALNGQGAFGAPAETGEQETGEQETDEQESGEQDAGQMASPKSRLTVLVGQGDNAGADGATDPAQPEASDDDRMEQDIDAGLLDEATLRRIVAEAVREELQGVLGERITRNVRKLVRREIRLVLAADELD